MSKNTQKTVAPASPAKVETPAIVLAPISVEAGAAAIKGLVAAARANQTAEAKAKRDYLANTVAAARLIGVPLTSAQFDRQVAKSLRDALTGKVDDVTSALSRAKVVTLATLCGGEGFAPVMGEGINAYLSRVRPMLDKQTLPDGTPVFAKSATGETVGKRGAKAGAKRKPSAPGSAGSVNADEGGDNASAKHRAALILMGSEALASRLVIIAGSHRDAFDKWSAGLLESVAKDATQSAMARARETMDAKRSGPKLVAAE
jgi:hypothetical protein